MTESQPHAVRQSIPADVRCAQDYEALAPTILPAPVFEYIAGGSGQGITVDANRHEFAAWTVCPRVLTDVTHGHTQLAIGGRPRPHPIMLAPVAHQLLAHPHGELDTARAAEATDSGLVTSTLSNHLLENVARLAGPGHWFQLYAQPDRTATSDLVQRAEAAGYAAIVLTVDAPVQMPSLRAQRAGFVLPPACIAANLQRYPPSSAPETPPGASRILRGHMRHAPTWDDLDWLRQQTSLPLWVKGILHADDARALQNAGIAGLIVSNHGGRGLDGVPASLAVLPHIRAAVGDGYPLLLDSGIRSGLDVFKALALGADAVLVGRLQMYALAVAGALGVAHMIALLREELELTMALAGCATLADVRRATLQRADHAG